MRVATDVASRVVKCSVEIGTARVLLVVRVVDEGEVLACPRRA